jgi:uncharacterized OsmC-like protein
MYKLAILIAYISMISAHSTLNFIEPEKLMTFKAQTHTDSTGAVVAQLGDNPAEILIPQATETLASGLNTCYTKTILFYAKQKGIVIDSISMQTQAVFDVNRYLSRAQDVSHYKSINVDVTVHSSEDKDKVTELIQYATAGATIYNTMRLAGIKMTYTLQFK